MKDDPLLVDRCPAACINYLSYNLSWNKSSWGNESWPRSWKYYLHTANPEVLLQTAPIKCSMNVCELYIWPHLMSFLDYWSLKIFLSAGPQIGWDECGCWVIASETKWFSIMPESKWREEAAEKWPKWAMLITSNQFCLLCSTGSPLPVLGEYPKKFPKHRNHPSPLWRMLDLNVKLSGVLSSVPSWGHSYGYLRLKTSCRQSCINTV